METLRPETPEALAEALASAARASAVPEVVTQGLLVDPDNEEALAAGIERLYRDGDLRRRLGEQGLARVEQFDAPRVAARFAEEVGRAISNRRMTLKRTFDSNPR